MAVKREYHRDCCPVHHKPLQRRSVLHQGKNLIYQQCPVNGCSHVEKLATGQRRYWDKQAQCWRPYQRGAA